MEEVIQFTSTLEKDGHKSPSDKNEFCRKGEKTTQEKIHY